MTYESLRYEAPDVYRAIHDFGVVDVSATSAGTDEAGPLNLHRVSARSLQRAMIRRLGLKQSGDFREDAIVALRIHLVTCRNTDCQKLCFGLMRTLYEYDSERFVNTCGCSEATCRYALLSSCGCGEAAPLSLVHPDYALFAIRHCRNGHVAAVQAEYRPATNACEPADKNFQRPSARPIH